MVGGQNKKYARLAALKTLDFALTRSTAATERFVDVLGLKSAFAAFMGKIKATSLRKLTPEEKVHRTPDFPNRVRSQKAPVESSRALPPHDDGPTLQTLQDPILLLPVPLPSH